MPYPGEIRRKVAPFHLENDPVLPEEVRGFRRTVIAKVLRKEEYLLDAN